MRIVSALLLLLCVSCGGDDIPKVKPPRPVHTYTIPELGIVRERVFSGSARSANEAPLSFRVDGEVTELNVKVGQFVAAGDIIAQLDTADYELERRRLEASLEQALAGLKRAWADYDRTRSLYEAQNVSKSVLDRDQALYKSAKAQHDVTAVALEIAQKQLDYCTLNAPMDGYISEVSIEAYQTIKSGQAIAKLTQGKDLEFEIGIPESLIGQIHVDGDATVSFQSASERPLRAVISEISVTTTKSSTYPVVLRVLEYDERIRSGMIGEATINFADSDSISTTVPPSAVVGASGKQQFVWVYQPATGSVSRRNVQVGSLVSKGIVVNAGLKPGEVIVSRGAHHLEEGSKVRLLEKTKVSYESR